MYAFTYFAEVGVFHLQVAWLGKGRREENILNAGNSVSLRYSCDSTH